MRIRKRPPRAVEAARAAPIVRDKPDSVPEALHAEVNIADRSERLTGGSVEVVFQVDTQARPRDRDAAEGAPEEDAGNEPGSSDKKEQTSSELLLKSLLVVFERSGFRGLTAREAVAKLIEFDLPGLQEGERSSVQVANVLRTPDFVHLEDGKYFIYPSTPHAVVAESPTHSEPSQAIFQAREDVSGNSLNFNSGRRKRGGAKQKENTTSDGIIGVPEKVPSQLEVKKRRRRPPSSQHELAIGPRQCKRYDGRGWQCSKETEEGFSFCEHHQALMNKRTLRLNLAKMKRSSGAITTTTITNSKGGSASDKDTIMDAAAATEAQPGSGNSNAQAEPVAAAEAAPHGIEDLIHNQRRKLVKARSLKSIK